jgi:hypothetical protein
MRPGLALLRTVGVGMVLLFVLFIGILGALVLIIVAFFIDGGQLERIAGDDLQFGPALITRNDLTLFNVVDVDVQGVIAFGAND